MLSDDAMFLVFYEKFISIHHFKSVLALFHVLCYKIFILFHLVNNIYLLFFNFVYTIYFEYILYGFIC